MQYESACIILETLPMIFQKVRRALGTETVLLLETFCWMRLFLEETLARRSFCWMLSFLEETLAHLST